MDYVVNPDTNRLIKRNGKTHRRWKRQHPDATALPGVSADPVPGPLTKKQKPYLPKNLSPVVRPQGPVPWLPSAPPAPGKMPLRSASAPVAGELDMPPLTRQNALGAADFGRLQRQQPRVQAEDTNMTPVYDGFTHDVNLWVDEVLAQKGQQLLQAYQDPNVDFLATLADMFGLRPLPYFAS